MKSVLEPEQLEKIDHDIVPLKNRTATLVVKSPSERAALVGDVKNAKTLKEKYEETLHLDANTVAARELYEATRDTRDAVYKPIQAFIDAGTKAVKDFDTSETLRIQREQREAKEREEQKEREEKARREAEEKAAIEQEEKRQLEEFERLENEKKKKQELQNSAKESGNVKVAGIAAKEVARIDNEIEKVKVEGEKKIEEIHAKAEEPAPQAPLRFTSPPPAPIKKLIWKARVVNMTKLCAAIGDGRVPFSVVEPRPSALNDFAKAYTSIGEVFAQIPGIEFYQETSGRL